MAPRRKFVRQTGTRRYRKLFLIATEGCKTEPIYFRMLDSQHVTTRVTCIKGGNNSAPSQVLDRMKKRLAKEGLRKGDEAWLVVDKDEWTDDQLMELCAWSRKKDNYGFALSNPKFEYWLLLHFEDGAGIATSRQCSEQLSRPEILPNYDKGFDPRKITTDMINNAIHRAESKDCPPCKDWPKRKGTTVYRLVRKILNSA
jgi:hypothetical protein